MKFRLAALADAEMLLNWRNDPETRRQSINSALVALADHQEWLKRSLANPDRRLWVAEEEGAAVGTLRADRLPDDSWELSWTIAPECRGRGLGKKMLTEGVRQLLPGVVLVAHIKPANHASIQMASAAGFVKSGSTGDLTNWSRS